MSRAHSLPRPPSAGGLSAREASGEMPESNSARGSGKDHISVAVRVRPIKYVYLKLLLLALPLQSPATQDQQQCNTRISQLY